MMHDADSMNSTSPADATVIPEHRVILLLEDGQQNLNKAAEAIEGQNPLVRDYHLKRVLIILQGLNEHLNPEHGTDLVVKFSQLFGSWGRDALLAGEQGDAGRIKALASELGEMRHTWEQVLFKGMGLTGNPEF